MTATAPYQPSLLRALHGIVAGLVVLAWTTGLIVFAIHDGRWWPLRLSIPGDWIDVHGTVGVLLWPIALLFAIYALSLGRARLKQPANAAALAALALAVGSGKLMQENWLRTGQLSHTVYTLHLTAWLLLGVTVMWHLAAVLRRGGPALAASMLRWQVRSHDHPRHWPQQLRRGLRR